MLKGLIKKVRYLKYFKYGKKKIAELHKTEVISRDSCISSFSLHLAWKSVTVLR